MPTPFVSVIIPCYNVEGTIAKCIQSVSNQSYPQDQFEIIVVDDGSSDGTVSEIKKLDGNPNVSIHAHRENRGLSAARNTGIKSAQGEILCFLDSDMTVDKDWIEILLDKLGDFSVVGVVGNVTLPEDVEGNTLDKYFYNPRRGARQFPENTPIGFQWFLFNNTAIRREIFDRVGVFDESIKSYGGEDTELAIRIWDVYPSGLRYSSKAASKHYHHRTMEEFCQVMESYGKNNLPLLLKRFPLHRSKLGGNWIQSIQGFLIFNPVIYFFVTIIGHLFPVYFLLRYRVVYSVIKGARKSR